MSQAQSSSFAVADFSLQARGLFCERDDRVLFRDLSFGLKGGEVLQVRGSNGSGKTTLLRIVCGINDNFDGELIWQGKELTNQYEDFRSDLAYIGHRVGINKVLSPLENLRFACGLQTPVGDEAILRALALMGLRGFEESQCFTLSAGQQQRVSLARLLLSTARLWVLDEPFTTLDIQGVAQLETLLQRHASAGGAVLVTTHHALSIDGLKVLELV